MALAGAPSPTAPSGASVPPSQRRRSAGRGNPRGCGTDGATASATLPLLDSCGVCSPASVCFPCAPAGCHHPPSARSRHPRRPAPPPRPMPRVAGMAASSPTGDKRRRLPPPHPLDSAVAGSGTASVTEALPSGAGGVAAAATPPPATDDAVASPRPRRGRRPQEGDAPLLTAVSACDDDGRARVAPPCGVEGDSPAVEGSSTKTLRARFVRALLLSTMELEG